jgi:hypothetical protein
MNLVHIPTPYFGMIHFNIILIYTSKVVTSLRVSLIIHYFTSNIPPTLSTHYFPFHFILLNAFVVFVNSRAFSFITFPSTSYLLLLNSKYSLRRSAVYQSLEFRNCNKLRNTAFRKLDQFPSSDEVRETPNLLGLRLALSSDLTQNMSPLPHLRNETVSKTLCFLFLYPSGR